MEQQPEDKNILKILATIDKTDSVTATLCNLMSCDADNLGASNIEVLSTDERPIGNVRLYVRIQETDNDNLDELVLGLDIERHNTSRDHTRTRLLGCMSLGIRITKHLSYGEEIRDVFINPQVSPLPEGFFKLMEISMFSTEPVKIFSDKGTLDTCLDTVDRLLSTSRITLDNASNGDSLQMTCLNAGFAIFNTVN